MRVATRFVCTFYKLPDTDGGNWLATVRCGWLRESCAEGRNAAFGPVCLGFVREMGSAGGTLPVREAGAGEGSYESMFTTVNKKTARQT